MKFDNSVLNVMNSRRSVRSYTGEAAPERMADELINAAKSLSDQRFRFELVNFSFGSGAKISTYGMIKGATAYLVGIVKQSHLKNRETVTDFGSSFEKLVLRATDLGYGTCWMAATFKSRDIERLLKVGIDEQIVMVSPVGPAASPRPAEKLIRLVAKSDKRLPWSDLFFKEDGKTALEKDECRGYEQALEMVRRGPSASNSQPWRVVMTDGRFDFYADRTKDSGKGAIRVRLSDNDLGIARAHFELAAEALGLSGEWSTVETSVEKVGDGTPVEYVFSWIIKWHN